MNRAVIVGAGALGLGFLAERLCGDYELCLADLAPRAPRARQIAAEQGFTLNVCHAGRLEAREVRGAFSAAVVGEAAFADAVARADLVLTAAGIRALPDIITTLAPILNGCAHRVWILFCENGLDIAARFGAGFAAHVTPMDTVMSRMCRFADAGESGYAPLLPGHPERLVAEACAAIPLDRERCDGGPFASVFDRVDSREFRMWEDVKLFMHNGMHAFLSYRAFLEGTRHFPDIRPQLRVEARRTMMEELVPAVLFHHPWAARQRIEAYALGLLERFVDPCFNDSIDRGVRGVEEKLAPGERLLAGRDYIREAGIDPRGYAGTIEAAHRILDLERRRQS